jgi:phage tail sheath protein FI
MGRLAAALAGLLALGAGPAGAARARHGARQTALGAALPWAAFPGASTGGAVLFGAAQLAGESAGQPGDWPLVAPVDAGALAALANVTSPRLLSALQAYFNISKDPGAVYVSACEDESATALLACIAATRVPQDAELLVVPALSALDWADYLSVAAALGQLAERADGLAMLDAPASVSSDIVSACQALNFGYEALQALANVSALVAASVSDPEHLVLYSLPLVAPSETGAVVSAASVMAGITSGTLPWLNPSGLAFPLGALKPAVRLNDNQIGMLNVAGVNSFFVLHDGSMSMPWGASTLARDAAGAGSYIGAARTLSLIRRTIRLGLDEFALAPNGQDTWSAVQAATEGFLKGLYDQGALVGAVPAQAYAVDIGPDTTPPTLVFEGVMVLKVSVALVNPAEFTLLTFRQPMVLVQD